MRSRLSKGTLNQMGTKANIDDTLIKAKQYIQEYFKVTSDKVVDPKRLVEHLNEIRKLLIITASEKRELLVDCFQTEGFLQDIVKYLNHSSSEHHDILEQITWIYLLIFSMISEQKLLGIIEEYDLITHLFGLLSIDHVEIFSNVVWCFANIMSNEPQMKRLLVEIKVFEKIEERSQEIEAAGRVLNPSFYQSFVIYLDSYLTTVPFETTQVEIENYLLRCLNFYVNCSTELLKCFETDLLGCIRHLTHFIDEYLLKEIIQKNLFGEFINQLFSSFIDVKYPYKNHILGILSNLTSDIIRDITMVFEADSIQKMLNNCLRNEETLYETAILLGNILLDLKVLDSFFQNKNEEIFRLLFYILERKVTRYDEFIDQIEEIVRTIQIFLIRGESECFVLFCLENCGKECT